MTRGQQIIWAIVVVIVLGGLYWWWQSAQTPALSDDGTPAATDVIDDSNTQPATTTTPANTNTGTVTSAAVTYNGSSFSPASVTIKQGGSVTFTSTGADMWIASDPHPTHTGYDGTSRSQHCVLGYSGAAPFDECAPGASFTFTFTKVGTWGYHNHFSADVKGSVTVVAQ